jgi:hypothetical protein
MEHNLLAGNGREMFGERSIGKSGKIVNRFFG